MKNKRKLSPLQNKQQSVRQKDNEGLQTDESFQIKEKKFSIFQIVSVVVIAILIVAIIVQIAVIVALKVKTDKLQDKLDKLPTTTQSQLFEPLHKLDL